MVVFILFSRRIGAEGYGHYVFAIALMTLIAIPVKMGLPNLIVRETARYQAMSQWQLMKGLWRFSLSIVFFLGILAGLISWGGICITSLSPESVRFQVLIWSLFLIPLIAVSEVRSAALKGLNHVILGLLPEQLIRPLALLLLLGSAVSVFNYPVSPVTAVHFHVIATGIAFLAGTVLLLKKQPAQFAAIQPSFQFQTWLSTAIPFGLTGAMQVINQNADVVILGMAKPAAIVGAYKAASQASMVMTFFLAAIGSVSAPLIAKYHTQKNENEVRRIYRFSILFSIAGALPPAIAVVFFGKPLIARILGPEFLPAYTPMVILCAGQMLNVCVGSIGFLLNMTGFERLVTREVGISAVMNIALNFILVRPFGASGAAIATTVSLTYWNLRLYGIAHNKLPYLKSSGKLTG